jgi:N6-adenosine-specific RNA methylase IME4
MGTGTDRDLILLDTAAQVLAEVESIEDALDIRDKAAALVHYLARRDKAGLSVARAEAIKLRAERRAGELLPEKATPAQAASKGGKAKAAGLRVKPAGTGAVTKVEAHRLRQLAAIPAPEFEGALAGGRKRGEATRKVRQLAKAEGKRARIEEVVSQVEAPAPGVYAGPLEGVPGGQWLTIAADPPWAYQDAGCDGAAQAEYDTMTTAQIAALDVGRLAHAEGCHLWMWTTWPMIREKAPHMVLAAWGFTWRSELVWDKQRFGVGRWLRKQTEVLILATRGRLPIATQDIPDMLSVARGRHSEKPSEAMEIIERASPGPRVELFAREARAGWSAWGNEVSGLPARTVRRV